MMKATSIILAGGLNKRLGRNKALLVINGQTMIERVINRLVPLTDEFLVVTGSETPELPVSGQAEIVADLFPGSGPLGGIYSGLRASGTLLNIVVACDMPFLNIDLLEQMLALSPGFDAVVPRLENGMVEPLHAVYSSSCLGKMKELLENKQLGVAPFLEQVSVRYIEPVESRKTDPELLSFFNINFPADYERAKDLAARDADTRDLNNA